MTEPELQQLLLIHTTYPYIRTTQVNIKNWNAWKIKIIRKKLMEIA